MKRDGWIREASGLWILRFRYDWESWDQNPKVWIERGRLESNGIPLLKNRKRMSRGLAKKNFGWNYYQPDGAVLTHSGINNQINKFLIRFKLI